MNGCCVDKDCNSDTCMKLPEGKTCGDCKNFKHCKSFYGIKIDGQNCDFFPRRFAVEEEKGGEA